MIDIKIFREFIVELRTEVNAKADEGIDCIKMAATESGLIKKLKDHKGIILCSNFPDADKELVNGDNWKEVNHVLLFVLEKVPSGSQTDGDEFLHYGKLQSIMERVKGILENENFLCGQHLRVGGRIRTEWEYNIYGGFNGLSLSFDLMNYD